MIFARKQSGNSPENPPPIPDGGGPATRCPLPAGRTSGPETGQGLPRPPPPPLPKQSTVRFQLAVRKVRFIYRGDAGVPPCLHTRTLIKLANPA